jgi:TRAP-type mannitol/chloroaromatic compound transport system permease small subunit
MNRVNNWIGQGASYLIWALTGLLLAETISRYGFNAPNVWSMEIAAYFFGALFLLTGGYTLLKEVHVRMDAFYARWTPRRRAIVDVSTFFLAAIYLGVLIWRGIPKALISFEQGERTGSAARLLLWPFKLILVVGFVLLLMQAVSFFIQDIYMAKTGKSLI